jgi:PAS domain S-box-containing protein
MKFPRNFYLLTGFVVALVILAGVAAINWRKLARMDETAPWVAHTERVRRALSALGEAIMDVQAGHRGYVLTGEKAFQRMYESGLTSIPVLQRQLDPLLLDAEQRASFSALNALVAERIASAEAVIRTYATAGREKASQEIRTLNGDEEPDEIRERIAGMDLRQRALLDERIPRSRRSAADVRILTLISTGASFALLAAVFAFAIREVRLRRKAGAAWRRLELSKRLHDSEERFRQLADHIDEVFWLTDLGKAEMIYVSPGYEAIWGRTCASLHEAPQGWMDAIHPDDRERVRQAALSKQAIGEYKEEYRIVQPDGSIRWILDRAFPVKNRNGVVFRIAGVARDITDSKHAEETLRASHTRMAEQAKMLSSVRDAVVARDLEQRIFYWNAGAERLYGWTAQDAFGCRGNILLYSDAEGNAPMEEILRTGEWRGELRQRHKGGNEIVVESFRSLLTDEAGNATGVLSINTDITARKQVQEQLEESNEMFRSLAGVAPAGIFRMDEDARCNYVNRHWCIMTGLSEEQAIGDGWSLAIHPEDRGRVLHEWREAASRRVPFRSEFRFRRPDGTAAWVIGQAAELTHPDGRVIGYVGTAFNITVQKQTESVLRALSTEAAGLTGEAFFQFIARRLAEELGVETGFVGRLIGERSTEIQTLAVWDGDHFVRNFVYELKGTPCENVVGKELCIYPSGVAERFPDDRILCDMGITSYGAFPLDDTSGRPMGLLGVMSRNPLRDPQQVESVIKLFAVRTAAEIERQQTIIALESTASELAIAKVILETERGQLADRVAERTADLSAANAELERANRLKSEFLANMSHELRTPLNAILGLSEAMIEQVGGPLTPRQVRSATTIFSSGQHLLNLINDILDLSKIEAGKLDLHLEPVDLDELCQACVSFVMTQATKKQIDLSLQNESVGGSIHADKRRLKQVLVNLLNNAVKFTPVGGRIGMTVTVPPGENIVRFTVWDTGIGISPEDSTRLFRAFTQIDSGLNRAQEGSGLGLALVAKLVDLHGGSVTLESEPGKGSSFTVTLPHLIPQNGTPSGVEASAQQRKFPRAMIFDDDPEMTALLRSYLSDLGFRSVLLGHCDEGLDAVLRNKPDLVLLDVMMPGLGGWELLAQLKDCPEARDIAVLVVSGVNNPEKSRALGAGAHLTKPFNREEFMQFIEPFVARRASPVISVAPVPAGECRPLILLAEDNEANIETMGGYLEELGHRMRYAHNGMMAVNMARQLHPALVLMDVQMPVMDGLSAIRELRADPAMKHTPIVALTGLAMPGDRERCLAAGADDYLSKPVRLRELANRISHHLNFEP